MTVVKQEEVFGTVLRNARVAKSWTQDQLVDRCGGIFSKSYLSQLENKRKTEDGSEYIRPAAEIVDALADALGEPRNYFRRLTGHPPVEDAEARDEVADDFGRSLHGYRKLNPEARNFVKRQTRATIEFLLEIQEPEPEDVDDQTITRKDPGELPSMSLRDVGKMVDQRKQKKKPSR